MKRYKFQARGAVGDDVSDYLAIGSYFSLWLGGDIGQGVVTRRLHV
jgi:hypothetical protein